MKRLKIHHFLILFAMLTACTSKEPLQVTVYETSANGNKLTEVSEFSTSENPSKIQLSPEQIFQTITGFGGSFTESSAYLLNRLSKKIELKLSTLTLVKKVPTIH
jgi:glucosylceramidase